MADSPIVDGLVSSKKDEVEALKNIPLLDLSAKEEGDGVVEGGQRLLKHELVACRQRADDVELQVGRRARQNDVRGQRVDVACGVSYARSIAASPSICARIRRSTSLAAPALRSAPRRSCPRTAVEEDSNAARRSTDMRSRLTSSSPRLLPDALLERPLLLQRLQPRHPRAALADVQVLRRESVRGLVVLGHHAVALRVEDEQRRDVVER